MLVFVTVFKLTIFNLVILCNDIKKKQPLLPKHRWLTGLISVRDGYFYNINICFRFGCLSTVTRRAR